MPVEYKTILKDIITISMDAGHEIMGIYSTDFGATRKDDNTPLTEADMAAHHTIVAGLQKLTPDLPILSEESADVPFEERVKWDTYWLVDPLDGTREFIKRNGEFTVNIALIDQNCPILGVIYIPVSGITYFACKGAGSFKQARDCEPVKIKTRPKPSDITLVAGSRSHRGDSLVQFLNNIGKHEIISMGSSLKSCLVAEGKADIYPRLGPTSEWDTAAAQCIVEEAGGKLTDLQLNPMRYNTKKSLLNPDFFVFGDANHDWAQYL